MTDSTEHVLQIRNLQPSDYPDVKQMMDSLYDGMGGAWTQDQFETLNALFPQGQICVEDKGRVVAVALTLIVDLRRLGEEHTYRDVVSDGRFSLHDPAGEYLYGIEVDDCTMPARSCVRSSTSRESSSAGGSLATAITPENSHPSSTSTRFEPGRSPTRSSIFNLPTISAHAGS
jgi:hypothetical protein